MNTHSSPTFRLMHPLPRLVAGVTAAAAALALSGLVFGRAADDRTLAFASVLKPSSAFVAARRAPDAERASVGTADTVRRVALAAAR